jgi:hypothetical protein
MLILLSFLFLTANLNAQTEDARFDPRRRSITVGILQGGGSLVGFDFEAIGNKQIGFQVGSGFMGFGAGINYHFKPTIRSSFLSLQYWHQGLADSYTQSLIGPSYVFRARKLLTFQAGLAYALDKGPAWPENTEQSPIMLMYAIGLYFPI